MNGSAKPGQSTGFSAHSFSPELLLRGSATQKSVRCGPGRANASSTWRFVSSAVISAARSSSATRASMFDLDGLGRVVEYAIGRPYSRGRRRIRIDHDLPQGGSRRATRLVQPCDRLGKGQAPGLTVRRIERGLFHPPVQRSGCHTGCASGFLDGPGRQERQHRCFPFPPASFCRKPTIS